MASELSDPSLHSTVLPNGIRVVTDPMPSARSATLGVWVGIGGRDEHDDLLGVSHCLEHLVFKGTESRSARSIAEDVDAVGGEMNAHTSREYTAFHVRVPDHAWRSGVELLADILTEPAFRAHEIEAERQVILEEILMSVEAPDDVVHQELSEGLFRGHPLGRDVLGTEASVSALDRAQIESFFCDHYRPPSLVVVAAGNVDHDELAGCVETRLGHLEPTDRPDRRSPGAEVEASRLVERAGEQVHVALGWRGLPFDHDDRYALAVATQILGGGMSSRLFQEVREERGLAYTVYAYSTSHTDAGAVSVYAGTGPRRARDLMHVLDDEIERFVRDGVTQREVEIATGYLAGATVLALEDTGGRMARVGRTLMHTDDVLSVDEQLARLSEVTVDDVGRVSAAMLTAPRTRAVVGPVDAERLAG